MKNNYQNYIDLRKKALFLSSDATSNTLDATNYNNSLLNSILLKTEYFYTYFALVFFTDALSFRSVFLSGEGAGQVSYEIPIDPLIGLMRYSIYAFTILITIIRFKMIFPILLRAKLILILTAIAYLSIFWSDVPEYTSRYINFIVGTTLFAIYIAGRYTFSQQLKLLAWALGTVLVMSFLFCILLPGYGLEQGIHAGAWRGVFWHKNNLGRYSAMGAILFCLMAQSTKNYKTLLWGLCGLSVFILVLSLSKTALVVFLVSFALLYLCYILAWDSIVSVAIFLTTFLIGCGITWWVILSYEKILEVLGKGVTLSGRTDIWDAVMPHIWQRPYLGHGYWSFWLHEGQGRYVWNDIGFDAAHAHNGFLDLILELGFVGLGLFLFSFILLYARSLMLVKKTKSVNAFWAVLFLGFFIMYNFSASEVLKDDSITWIFYVTLAFSLDDLALSREIGSRD
jgi:exopolysaccharide production protein ExoQ